MSNRTLDGSLMSVRDFGHNLHVRLGVDDRNDRRADERGIVDTQNSDATFPSYPSSARSPAFANFVGQHGLWISLTAAGVNVLPVICG
jgi:hypothetical protein